MRTSGVRLPRAVLLSGLLLTLSAGLGGCSLFRSRLVTLCTNHPEMAVCVELFNALGPEVQVVLCYQEDPAAGVASRSADADVVIAEGLNGAAIKRNLDSLDRLFGEDGLNRQDFYPGLLQMGVFDRRQTTLPVSFRLPAIVFLTNTLGEDLPNLSVSAEYLRGASGSFRTSVRERYVRMGFSPLWDDRLLYDMLRLHGAEFRESGDGGLRWKPEGLSTGLSFLATWVEEADGGKAKTAEFSRRYLYEPLPKLLEEKRILFYPSDSSKLVEDLESQRGDADFRWLSGPAGILVDESVVSIAIPRNARNKWGARIFVDWLLDETTQKHVLGVNQAKRLSTFGIVGGFSSLRRLTEREFPQLYPVFIGRIPQAELLAYPNPLPAAWQTTKRDALLPWVRSFLGSGTPVDQSSQALEAAMRAYRSERPAKQ
jgi:ABC-type glycerol-3-phosphate transport system substrate-binding protein